MRGEVALPHLPAEGRTLVLYGDVPLIDAPTLQTLLDAAGEEVGLLTDVLENPTGYGQRHPRGWQCGGDCGRKRRRCPPKKRCRKSTPAFSVLPNAKLEGWLNALQSNNAQGEYYLTDLIALANADGIKVHPGAGARQPFGRRRKQ